MNKYANGIGSVLAIVILMITAYMLFLVGDRVIAAIWNFWKFSGFAVGKRYKEGIDIGALEVFYFLIFSMFSILLCAMIGIFLKGSGNVFAYKLLYIAGAFIIGSVIGVTILIVSGLAFMVCR